MKPHTKLEKHVLELSGKLRPIRLREIKFAETVFMETGDQYGSLCTCHECGHQWRRATNIKVEHLIDTEACWHAAYSMRNPEKEYDKCPNCGKNLEITHKEFNKHEERGCFGVIDYIDGFHVVRMFLVRKNIARKQPASYSVYGEPIRYFVEVNGSHNFVIACKRNPASYNWCDQWILQDEMSLKSTDHSNSYYGDPYNQHIACIGRKLAPELKGCKWHDTKKTPVEALVALRDPHCFTLFKAGLDELFAQYDHSEVMDWSIMKICLRNHYDPEDGRLYRDYLGYLEDLGKDLHNAYYVCPQDLIGAHGRYQKIYERKKDALAYKKKERELEKYEKKYAREKKAYLGIILTGEDLTIRPLQSVKEFYEEGKAMHHCVFDRQYFLQNTIIMTARDSSDKRLATIEFEPFTGKVLQCRAFNNAIPPRQTEIVSLILHNLDMFRG